MEIDNASRSVKEISVAVFDTYKSISNNGKPSNEGEFTVLSSVVAQVDDDKFLVVSLCTGTKCNFTANIDQLDFYRYWSRSEYF